MESTETIRARGRKLYRVDTGNMGGDLWRDRGGRAYWPDGSRVEATEVWPCIDALYVMADARGESFAFMREEVETLARSVENHRLTARGSCVDCGVEIEIGSGMVGWICRRCEETNR